MKGNSLRGESLIDFPTVSVSRPQRFSVVRANQMNVIKKHLESDGVVERGGGGNDYRSFKEYESCYFKLLKLFA